MMVMVGMYASSPYAEMELAGVLVPQLGGGEMEELRELVVPGVS